MRFDVTRLIVVAGIVVLFVSANHKFNYYIIEIDKQRLTAAATEPQQ